VIILLPTRAQAECVDAWVCVERVTEGDSVELRARNLKNYPITYTLALQTSAYAVAGASSVTRTLRPQASEAAIQMTLLEGARADAYDVELDWTVGVIDAKHDNDHLYAFPYQPGRTYRIMQSFESRFSHTGIEQFAIDFEMPEGSPVHAARSGVIAQIEEGNSVGCWQNGCSEFANYIVVLHSDGTTGEYYHLKQNGSLVEVGDSVARGDLIGYSGNTGNTAVAHLHFAVYRPTSAGNTQSIPIRFQSADGVVSRPRRGGRHQAAYQ
jgi:murein DD-endopeptidase MepM/ murein hydrolase activator NlpD